MTNTLVRLNPNHALFKRYDNQTRDNSDVSNTVKISSETFINKNRYQEKIY